MWLPQENENERRPKDHQPQTTQRPQTADNSLIRHPFPKSARILHRSHYKNILRFGSRIGNDSLRIDFRIGRSQRPRLGITVSRKQGKSHERNRFKRLVREVFRELYPSLPQNLEVNVCPRQIPIPLERKKIYNDFCALIEKIRGNPS